MNTFSATRVLLGAFAAATVALAAGCGGGSSGGGSVPVTHPTPTPLPTTTATPPSQKSAYTQLKHIVVVIQENRSDDNLFNGFCIQAGPCADTVTADPVTGTPLHEASLAAPYSPDHAHSQFIIEYDGGKMDGWAKSQVVCTDGERPCPYTVFGYAPKSQTAIYRQLATVDGVFSDETFETEQGPSLPAHYYAIAGQSGGYDSDRLAIADGGGTCATPQSLSRQIDMRTPYPGRMGPSAPACKDFQTIFDELARANHSWRFYSDGQGFWSPTQGIQHLYNSPNYVQPPSRFLSDVAAGQLADVTFVGPTPPDSDHPGMVSDPLAGPNWVASVVNAVGETPFWNDTAIVVYWDDWGGWFDHVAPPASPVNPDPFEYGFRVPLIVASPYAKLGTIDHTTRTFVSTLRLIEETFKLPMLGTTDRFEPDGLDSMFDFYQQPFAFKPIGGAAAKPFSVRQSAGRKPR